MQHYLFQELEGIKRWLFSRISEKKISPYTIEHLESEQLAGGISLKRYNTILKSQGSLRFV